MEVVTRGMSLDVFAPDEQRQAILDGIRRYRAACREMYGVLLAASAAGAEIIQSEKGVQLKPSNDRAAVVLAAALDRAAVAKTKGQRGEGVTYTVSGSGAALGYDLRPWFTNTLYPDSLAFVFDSARRDVETVWKSGDPEFPKAKRGWLALQGARGVAQFQRRGIGCPVATARPKLAGHTLTLKWDRAIGPVVLALGKLDGGRYYPWKCLRDDTPGWKLGTVYLNERAGRLFAVLSYSRPAVAADVDPQRVCAVRWSDTPAAFLQIVGPDGMTTADSLSALDALGWLVRLRVTRERLEARKAACGNPRAPWGHRKGWRANVDVLGRNTASRELQQRDANHAWTRRIVTRARDWRCGVIRLREPAAELFGHPWGWHQFKEFLRYKATECGIEVAYEAREEGAKA